MYLVLYQTSLCHILLFSRLLLYHIPFLLLDFTLFHCVNSPLPLLGHEGTSLYLFYPPPGYWYTSFLSLARPGLLHDIAVSAFSPSPLGPWNYFLIPVPSLIPVQTSKHLSCCTSCSLALAFPWSGPLPSSAPLRGWLYHPPPP